jgi:hypothetical protein
MGKGLGIAALVLSILSLFSPIFVNITALWVAMGCATFAVVNGDKGLSIAAVVIGLAGIVLFSPMTLAALGVSLDNHSYRFAMVVFLPFAFPIVALIEQAMRHPAASPPGELR